MPKLLLLYDTKENDLARDFRDLLQELSIDVDMIPLSADNGRTLAEKERDYFQSAGGALFLLTPGATRDEMQYPSPSLSHEMGLAEEHFRANRERVMYLRDAECQIQTVDQRVFTSFSRKDIRSVLAAVTSLVRNLKPAGFICQNALVAANVVTVPIQSAEEIYRSLVPFQIQVIIDVSHRPNGTISDSDLAKLIISKNKNMQDVNIFKRHSMAAQILKCNMLNNWVLSEIGWAIVEWERQKERARELEKVKALTELLSIRANRKT